MAWRQKPEISTIRKCSQNWCDSAPLDYPYPWKDLNLPWIPREAEAIHAALEMKDTGNSCFKKGDYYDALWKYEHSLTLLDSLEQSSVEEMVATLHSNIAACCLKLGDQGRTDVLHSEEGFPVHLIMWYGFGHQHAHQAILLDPKPQIAQKAFRRRGDSYKKMMRFPGMENAIKAFMPVYSNPYTNIICDYVASCKLQDNPDPKLFYEALAMAVNEDQTELIPALTDFHIKSGFTSRLLKEAFSEPSSTQEHIEFILFDMSIESSVTPYFNADSLSPVPLLRKEIFGVRLYKKLIEFGLPITGQDIDVAVKQIPGSKLSLFKYLVSKCCDLNVEGALKSACDSAEKLKKTGFLEVLKEQCKSLYSILKEEGNTLFAAGDYEQALGKYFQALKYCRDNNMKKEMSLIRANCAQACLKLQMFNDAYTHCCECIKLDRTNYKGYYRRAQALKGLLPTSSEYGSYVDVVKDYLKCCELHQLEEAFAQAVLLAVKHGCTHLVPKIRNSDVKSGFSREFFTHLVTKYPLDAKLLHYIVMKLPDNLLSTAPYDASCLHLKSVLCKTTEGPVIRALLKCGIMVKEDDVLEAVQTLTDTQVDIFEMILSYSTHHEDPLHSCLNLACSQAINYNKRRFVVALIKRGSTPPPNQLLQVSGVFEDPYVQNYLETVSAAMLDKDQEDNEEIDQDPLHMMSVLDLNAEARRCFKAKDVKGAIKHYNQALKLCEVRDLAEEAASIHNNLAHLYLETGKPDVAYKHADVSIRYSQDNPKGYYRRAEATKCILKNGKSSSPGQSYSFAIQDYKRSYQLKAEIKTLVEALILACEHGKLNILLNECKTLPHESCQKLLHLVLAHQNCKPTLIEFLMLEAWGSRVVDCHKLKLKALLVDKRVTKADVLKRFLLSGISVDEEDLSCAIRTFSNNDIEMLKMMVTKCETFDKNKLCKEASAYSKTTFVLYLCDLGATLPDDSSKLFYEALKVNDFNGATVLVKSFTAEMIQELDFGALLKTTNLVTNVDLIKLLMKMGISLSGKTSPILSVMNQTMNLPEKIEMICFLIEGGVDCKQLCRASTKSTTPLHVATDLALKSEGITKLIDVVLASSSFDKSTKFINDRGETPLHLAAKPHLKKSVSSTVLKYLLQTGIIDPSTKDKSQKRARDYITGKGKDQQALVKMLEDAAAQFHPKREDKKKKKPRNGDKGKSVVSTTEPVKKAISAAKPVSPKKKPDPVPPITKKVINYADMTLIDKIAHHLTRISQKNEAYFLDSPQDLSSHQESIPAVVQLQESSSDTSSPKRHRSTSRSRDRSGQVVAKLDVVVVGDSVLDGLNFDSLPWEVEITRSVVKFFKNTKRYSPTDRLSAARVMYSIAEGRRNLHLSKQVGSSKNVCLFEARITDSGRILWEKAVTYSKKLTGDTSYPVYTEVIRVWEVILDHDDLDRRITYCSEQIVQSYERGYLSAVRRPLKPIAPLHVESESEGVRGKEVLTMPCTYTTKDLTSISADTHFVPAASTNESEYNVTTFYSFDTVHAKSMITGNNEKRDYPFKEWQMEHEIIKISSKEAILLLGRSGTGKTTCCLYRLWNEFKNYWNPDSERFGYKIPRKTLVSASSLDYSDDELSSDSDESCDELSADEDSAFDESSYSVPAVVPTGLSVTSSPGNTVDSSSGKVVEMIEEDLHQVFVTKNYVLCDQMKKRFYCMVAAYDFMEPHLDYEEEQLPNSFSKFQNLSFPAFLTARQFYMILDNSLGGDSTFFKRDADGNLQVKISSLDYDHEDADILLDLEESDSEDDEVKLMYQPESSEQPAMRQHSAKWTEVTALYFKEIIWPKISHSHIKEFDPMLVWLEIQSFIKGSELAVRKGSPLSLEQYKSVGNRMAPNFSNHRETIYKLFLRYRRFVQNCRHSNFLFDECDLVLDLHNRLKTMSDVSWSIHSVYIDEVQDFTQSELAIFIHCCRDPNSMFFTGDTAQSIMRGIAFRFQDLRSCFHRIHSKVPYINVPQEPLKLTINYRSHSGILKLAGSVIDLISEFFKDSIDHLPDDEGMFPGPMPVFLDSCEERDLSLLLSTNKRECSAIEFGAHQVILVQSKEAKDRLPDILKGAIVLTIFESKGLEFDDVLLYNFFTDSLVSEKDWRVVTSYLEMPQHARKIERKEALPGRNTDPRSKPFNPTLHKSLNAELKYLYTAITRAKCNLWIYDSNNKNRLPMLDYWHKRNTVKVVTDSGGGGKDFSLVFASNSTPEQWSAQGDNFRKKHLWEQAILCYEKAGIEYAYLVKEAYAYHYIQEARLQKPQLFLKAAQSFLERDELSHSVHCLNGAALCLKTCKPPRYVQAARLFEKLGDLAKAAQCFLKGRDFDNFSRIQENQGDYNSVIRTLQGKPFMRKRDALAKADEYEKKGYSLDAKFTPSELSFSCAKFYADRKDNKMLLEVLKFMPEQERRVKFLKEALLFDKAFDDYCANDQYASAYRLASVHGWFDKGIALAKKAGNEVEEAKFIIQQAKHTHTILSSQSDVDSGLISSLKKVANGRKSMTPELKLLQAEANLLLGMLLRQQGPCITALGQFRTLRHKAGQIEAFDQAEKHGEVSKQSILDSSHVAKRAYEALSVEGGDMKLDVKQAVKFFGLQLVGKVYLTSPVNNIWISNDVIKKLQCDDPPRDIDGMMRLKSEIKAELANRYREYVTLWPLKTKLEASLQRGLLSFKLHSELYANRSLSRQYLPREVSSTAMREYIQDTVHFLEFQLLDNSSQNKKIIDSLIVHILAIFSPQVYIYLPWCLNEQHIQTVRRSHNSSKRFENYIDIRFQMAAREQEQVVKINEWLFMWRATCIAPAAMKLLLEKINDLELKVGKEASRCKDEKGFKPPPGYVYWNSEKRYSHVFSFWLNSCADIREKSRVLWAAKLAITHFLGNVAEDKQVSISVMNGVDILSVYCTALLAMITHANVLQNIPVTFVVPSMYKYLVQLFSHMNCRSGSRDKSLLAACAEQVSSYSALGHLFKECKFLLIKAMGYLIGTYQRAPWFSLLKFGLTKFPSSDATKLCLVLTFTLLGNLAVLKVKEIKTFEDKILNILKKAVSKTDGVPDYVVKMYKLASQNYTKLSSPHFAFNFVTQLLVDAQMDCTMSRLVFKAKSDGRNGHFEFVEHRQKIEPRHSNLPKSTVPASSSIQAPPSFQSPPTFSASQAFPASSSSQPAFQASSPAFPASSSNQPTFPAFFSNQPAFPASSSNQPAFPASSSNQPAFPVSSLNQPASAKLPASSSIPSKLPQPSVTELGEPLPVSPPTAPIGSERRQAGTGSSLSPSSENLVSQDSAPTGPVSSSLNPFATSYLPPVTSSFAQQATAFQEKAIHSIGHPPGLSDSPMGQPFQPVEQVHRPHVEQPSQPQGQFSETSTVHPSQFAFGPLPEAIGKPAVGQHSHYPSGSFVGHVPEVGQPQITGQDLSMGQQFFSPEKTGSQFVTEQYPPPTAFGLPPSFSTSQEHPNANFLFNYQPFFFTEDSFVYPEEPDNWPVQDDTGAGMFPEAGIDEVFGLTLTQVIPPNLPIDPSMLGDDIIDEANNFCIVCGITFFRDDIMAYDDAEQDNVEGFYAHVTGNHHHSNTVAYKRFVLELHEMETEDVNLIQLAGKKLEECKQLKEQSETEQLDQIIDDLQMQIGNYDREISEFKDNRNWREGIARVSEMHAQIDRLLKSANDLVLKVRAELQARQQQELYHRRERFVEDDDGLHEIDELSARYEKIVGEHTKVGKVEARGKPDIQLRSMHEKAQSRDRKRSKKIAN